ILVDPSLSSQLVRAHLVNGSLDADAIFAQPNIKRHPGDAASRTIAGDFGPVSISASDQAANGWVHTITRVLSAPAVTTAPTGGPHWRCPRPLACGCGQLGCPRVSDDGPQGPGEPTEAYPV